MSSCWLEMIGTGQLVMWSWRGRGELAIRSRHDGTDSTAPFLLWLVRTVD